MYKDFAVGIDVSAHNALVPVKPGSIDFLIARMGGTTAKSLYPDETFPTYCQKAYDADIPFLAYWFVTPGYWLGQQYSMSGVESLPNEKHPIYQMIFNSLKPGGKYAREIHALAFDVEDLTMDTTAGQVTPAWITFYIDDLCKRLNKDFEKGNLPRIRLGVYSRTPWMKICGKDLEVYLSNHPEMFIWPAQWIPGPKATVPLADIRKYLPTDAAKCAGFGWSADRIEPPDWTIWQISGDAPAAQVIKLAETSGAVDVDIFHGTMEQLHRYFNYTPRTTPVVVDPPVVVEPPVVVIPPADSTQLDRIETQNKQILDLLQAIKPEVITAAAAASASATAASRVETKMNGVFK